MPESRPARTVPSEGTRATSAHAATHSIHEDPEVAYTARSPERALLHRVVREQIEPFLAGARAREQPAPRFIEQELHAFLRCGILAHGFLRLHCDDCGHNRLVPFSCKRRGFCPSCGGRRMADTSAHLVDRVFPSVPVRQWVLTLPYPLRYRCAYDAKLTSEVLRAFLRALFAQLRRRIRRHWGALAEQCGAVSFIQRFGSALNPLAGRASHPLDDKRSFMESSHPPFPFDQQSLVALFVLSADPDAKYSNRGHVDCISRLVASRAEGDDDALARDEPLPATLAAASLRSAGGAVLCNRSGRGNRI